MAVVVQAAFRIEILPLKAQRIVDFAHVEPGYLAVSAVVGGPDDFAFGAGQFLRGAEVVELVVVGRCGLWAEAFQQRQWAEAVGFVEVAAMAFCMMFGNQLVALPEKLGGYVIHGLADAPSKRVVAIAGGLAVGLGDADEPMLAVVAVLSDELLALAAPLTNQVAEGVVVVMAVALDHQAVGCDDVGAGAVLHEQVAGGVVAEAFLYVLRVIGAGQAGEGVVVVAVFAFAGVEQAGEVAAFVVVVLALS